jgi:hypothetical protein
MKRDHYTNFILTVIAVTLIAIALKPTGFNVVSSAGAQTGLDAPRVNINIESIAGKKLRTIPMSKGSPALPVEQIKEE